MSARTKQRLLVCAQAVDLDDPLFGFFVAWLEASAKEYVTITVCALRVGRYALPSNVTVVPLRSEDKGSRLAVLQRLLIESWRRRREYDVVFVRGDAIYLVLAGWLWKLLGKQVLFWYTHYAVKSLLFWIGSIWADHVLTAVPESNPLRRALAIGHHIDVRQFPFNKTPSSTARVLLLGRVSPVKRVPWVLDALAPVVQERTLKIEIVGKADTVIEEEAVRARLNSSISWENRAIPHEDVAERYHEADIFVNATPGSMDKTLLEAAASGCIVLAATKGILHGLAPELAWLQFATQDELRCAVEKVLALSVEERSLIRAQLRAWVEREHSLQSHVQKVAAISAGQIPVRTLLFCQGGRMPTEKANGLQVTKMCVEFVKQGLDVLLLVPQRKNPITTDVFTYYHLPPIFSVEVLPTPDTVTWGKLGFWLHLLVFSYRAASHPAGQRSDTAYYVRDIHMALILYVLGRKQIFWEAHKVSPGWVTRYVAPRLAGIIYITEGVRRALLKESSIDPGRLLLAPDGVDLAEYADLPTKAACREALNMPADAQIVLYTGHLYDWKGADVLAEAAAHLPERIRIWFVGGTQEDVARFRERYKAQQNIVCAGHVDHARIPLYQKAADILVLPNSARFPLSKDYTSPLKLFEYMASGTPIVASDLPSLREILSDNMVMWCLPDDPSALAHAIQASLGDPFAAEMRAEAAKQHVTQYTWTARASQICRFMNE